MSLRVFISYSRYDEDKQVAQSIVELLDAMGVEHFIDEDIEPGEDPVVDAAVVITGVVLPEIGEVSGAALAAGAVLARQVPGQPSPGRQLDGLPCGGTRSIMGVAWKGEGQNGSRKFKALI